MQLTNEYDSSVVLLRKRMDAFYASCSTYDAFHEPNHKPEEWAYVKESILERLQASEICDVLEFGAGCTGFSEYLGDLRKSVRFTVQDVTPSNRAYLEAQADGVHIGSLAEVRGSFDVIFSTFVLEHISDPRQTLETLLKMLKPGGHLLLFCPRYDFPFYLSHSADHYPVSRRLWMALHICWRRLASLFSGRPAFVIHTDPAVLHLDWKIDRDAIHWASLIDLRVFFRSRGHLKELAIRSGSFKDWFVKKCLRINIRFTQAAT